jgi:hypothetical protein
MWCHCQIPTGTVLANKWVHIIRQDAHVQWRREWMSLWTTWNSMIKSNTKHTVPLTCNKQTDSKHMVTLFKVPWSDSLQYFRYHSFISQHLMNVSTLPNTNTRLSTIRHTGPVTTHYITPIRSISSNSKGSKKLPDDGRLLPKRAGVRM